MYLSKPLIAEDGKILLHEGIVIKERYIEYLRKQGFTSLFVGDPKIPEVLQHKEEFYSLENRQAAIAAAREVIDHFKLGKGVNVSGIKKLVNEWIYELGQKPEQMVNILDIRRKEDYMFSHAVNTCILSIMTGMVMGYNEQQLDELGLAAMLHDVGKTKFSKNVAQQYSTQLTSLEREEYRRHPFYALEILRSDPTISTNVLSACFQHHERWNGSGYPMGIKGKAISEYAQIISIADVYDRLTTWIPHRQQTPVYYATAILHKAAKEYFNPAIVDKFNQNIAIYPIGKTVRLSNQQLAIIVGIDINHKTVPIVRIAPKEEGVDNNEIITLDLQKNPELFIVDFEELPPSYPKMHADRAYISHVKDYHEKEHK